MLEGAPRSRGALGGILALPWPLCLLCDLKQVAFLLWASVCKTRGSPVCGLEMEETEEMGRGWSSHQGKRVRASSFSQGSRPLRFVRVLWPLDSPANSCLLSREGAFVCSRFKVPGKADGGHWQAQGREEPARRSSSREPLWSQAHWVRSPDLCSGKVTLSGLCSQSQRRGSLVWLLRPLSTRRTE